MLRNPPKQYLYHFYYEVVDQGKTFKGRRIYKCAGDETEVRECIEIDLYDLYPHGEITVLRVERVTDEHGSAIS